MKIAIIGTINKDLILPFKNPPIESFGGIFYDISILSELLGEDDEIIPVSFIGEDIAETARAILAKMGNVSQEGLITVEQRNHKVILEYTSPQDRAEKSLFQFEPLQWKHLAPALEADMIIVNLISGWDIDLKTFKKLKAVAGDRLYLDVHYLTMDVDNLGRRIPRKPEHFKEWLQGPKFVQMNEVEYELLADMSRNEINFYNQHFSADQVLLITRGAKGAVAVYQRGDRVRQRLFPAFEPPIFIDTTGCGDAFGAGFVVRLLQGGEVSEAVEFGNMVAAANIALRGTNEMHRLRETIDIVRMPDAELAAGGDAVKRKRG